MDLFEILSEIYKDYETTIETRNDGDYYGDIDYFVIINPHGSNNIEVSNPREEGIIFWFSYQHAHFDYCDDMQDNIEDLIEYINDFLEDRRASIEFLDGDTPLFGGDRNPDDIDTSSGESILKDFVADNDSLYKQVKRDLEGIACRCSIRGWSGKHDRDINFVL